MQRITGAQDRKDLVEFLRIASQAVASVTQEEE
jgi:hypothetical protein